MFINKNILIQEIRNAVISEIKGFLEKLMVTERDIFLQEENIDTQKNGFYNRNLDTIWGKLCNLKIPRDRNSIFKTALFEPYKRREIHLEELLLAMYSTGM